MDEIIRDLRYALRQMVQRPGFSAILITTLALGIGANTAVFSVVNGVVLRPLPYPEPERLTAVWSQFPTMELLEFPSSWPEFVDYRDASRSFESMGTWGRTQRTITGGESPERLDVAQFSASMFRVLRVEPALGRVFGPEEDVAGRDAVAVLSHALWQRRFGGDPTVVGRTVELDGSSTTVLGVMPEGFGFPDRDTQAWLPAGIDPTNPPSRSSHFANILGRLAPGVTLEEATVELGNLVARWEADDGLDHTWSRELHPAFLRPLHADTVGDVRRSLLVLLGAVGIVLLIACANVANLLLVRGEGRAREISVRAAIGAGRGRIVRQLVTESLLVAVLGGAAGLLLARFGLTALVALAPPDLPRLDTVALDGRVLAFSAAAALLSGLLFGLAPALQTVRTDVQGTLRNESRGGTAGPGRFRLRRFLVIGQTALAVVLLVGGGLLLQSYRHLSRIDPGFRGEGVLAASINVPQTSYPEDEDVMLFYRDLVPGLAALPGVTAAGMVRTAPLAGTLPPNDIEFENRIRTEDDPPLNADIQVVSPGYFEALSVPVLWGRGFDATDDESSETVVVVDETFARRFFGNPADALGHGVRQYGTPGFSRIVGVAGGVRQVGLDSEPRAQLYLLHAQSPRTWFGVRGMTLLLRTDGDPGTLVDGLRTEVRSLDPNLPVFEVGTVQGIVEASVATERFNLFLQLVFAGVALSLAAIGLYGVLSYSVVQRTREIGIRIALGAERDSIVGLVVRQGLALVVVAIGVGVVGALVVGQALSGLLFEVSPRDPTTYVVVTAMLGVVAALACWIPARRASGVDPQTALRSSS